MHVIGVMAPTKQFADVIRKSFAEEVANGQIIIELIPPNAQQILEQAQTIVRNGADVILARGSTYDIIKNDVSVPTIQVTFTVMDVLDAIMQAAQQASKVVLIRSPHVEYEYERLTGMLRIDFASFRCEDSDVPKLLESLKGKDIAIVGGRVICHLAQEVGLIAQQIHSTRQTIVDAVNGAKNMLDKLEREIEAVKQATAVLENVHDAVISTDQNGIIRVFNIQAARLFQTTSVKAIGKNIQEVAPELSELLFERGTSGFVEKIFELNRHTVSANLVKMEFKGSVLGWVCVFQDVADLQNAEKRIRMELHKKGFSAKYTFDDIVYQDERMAVTIKRAKQVAQSEGTVLLYGESGTGKEMFAHSIHNYSRRRNGPFVAVNCCALSETLLESELFGYVNGAFTGAAKGGKAGLFELAQGGTIFLDEINSISTSLQIKLLRVLQEKEIMRIGSDKITPLDIRVIAAANESLFELLKSGAFRRDLYYRLSIFEVHIPPLRERGDDVIHLFRYFVETSQQGGMLTKEKKEADWPALYPLLKNYHWGGNIRELKSVAERYVLGLWQGESLDSLLSLYSVYEQQLIVPQHPLSDGGTNLREIMKLVERGIINELLKQGYSKSEVAKLLGISRTSVWNQTKRSDTERDSENEHSSSK